MYVCHLNYWNRSAMLMHAHTTIIAVTVGFEEASYTFNEDEGGMVCVVLEEGSIESSSPITLTLNVTDGSATGSISLPY